MPNGQGLGGMGFSGGYGQPGAVGMGSGGMGGGFSGLNPQILELLSGVKFNPGYGLGYDAFYQRVAPKAYNGLQSLLSGGMQPQSPAAAPQAAPQAPQAPPSMLTPVTPQSPYAGLLGQQGGQGGYGGLLSRMLASPNRPKLARPGIA